MVLLVSRNSAAEFTIYEKPKKNFSVSLEEIDKAARKYNIDSPNYNIKSDAVNQDFPVKKGVAEAMKGAKMCRVVKLLVEKGKRKMSLFYGDELQKTYEVRLGFTPKGKKEKRNDGKTPEGVYSVQYKNAKSQFYKSFAVSYPNQDDLSNARKKGFDTGGDIMIHGLPNNSTLGQKFDHWRGKDWTAGCIAVKNEEMDELWRVVDQGAIIVINP